MEQQFAKLNENTKPKWGIMTAQHLVEHMEYFTQMALGNVPTEITTPEKYMERTQDSLWNYKPMPKEFDHPILKKGEVEDLRFENLAEAKTAFFKAYDELEIFFKENPQATVKNTVFGNLSRYEWQLLNRKHFAHHFEQFGI